MRRVRSILAAALVLGLGAFVPAGADDGFVVVGSIAAANPLTKSFAGFTETSNPCGRPHPRMGDTRGVDGQWIALPAEARGRDAMLRSDAVDADVWFYRLEAGVCVLIDASADPGWASMATDLTPDEDGVIPALANFAIVDAAVGDGVAFTFAVL